MRRQPTNGFSIFLNIVLILFLIFYFLVGFLNYPLITKTFSPLCSLITRFQGPDYLPAWCSKAAMVSEISPNTNQPVNQNENTNLNSNVNTNVNTNTNSDSQMANPASVKCLADGGKLDTYDSLIGQFSLCVFSDNSICDEWAYFRGECNVGQCFKQCQQANSSLEGWYNSCTKELIKLDKCAPSAPAATEPNIIVSAPTSGQQLTSPFKVEGRARVFENQVNIRVKNKSGQVLITEKTLAKAPEAGQWGDFSISIGYQFFTTKEGVVEVYATSAKDGSEQDLVSIPVKF